MTELRAALIILGVAALGVGVLIGRWMDRHGLGLFGRVRPKSSREYRRR